MKKDPSKINLFAYVDYRKYLKDLYQQAKRSRGSFSFRLFSKRAGFKSTNFLKLIMEGDRNLSEDSLSKFIIGLKLNKQEQEFFRNLVYFNQAKAHEQKDLYYKRLLRSRKYNQLKPIEREQYDYYSAWYHPVVRELVVSKKFDGSIESLARQISPEIPPAQIQKSIELLERLGFIQKTSKGKWKQASSLVSTGSEVPSVMVFNYHKLLLDLTKEILDTVPSPRRDISTMTLGMAQGRIPEIKKKIQEFRQEILKMVAMDNTPDEVVQLNIQLFPLTQEPKEPPKESEEVA